MMKTKTNIVYLTFALFVIASLALSPLIHAACPEICDGNNNTAVGFSALQSNTQTGNTAVGADALELTNAVFNTGVGYEALFQNTSGTSNTASGTFSLSGNMTGSSNTATGEGAMEDNIGGSANTANGVSALFMNISGNNNTADGVNALFANTGSNNVALGAGAGSALTNGNYNINIGNVGLAGESNTIRVGTPGASTGQTAAYIAGIYLQAIGSGPPVHINSQGKLGTIGSSARFKEAIKPMKNASEPILALRPVTFRYNKEIDSTQEPQFGLVAEDVEKVDRDLVEYDAQGKPFSVRYEAVSAMLLNEFLKEHERVEKQECKIDEQEAKIARQQKQIEALMVGLQTVSAQLEVNKASPETVSNN